MLPAVLEEKYIIKNGETDEKTISKNFKYKPYQFLPFMKIFKKTENGFVLDQKRLIINDDYGIGIKTEIGIILRQLLLNDQDLRVVIFADVAALSSWKKELCDNFGLDFKILGEDGKDDDELLIAEIGNNSKNKNWDNIDLEKFEVQIFSDVDFYLESYLEKVNAKKKLGESDKYLLRIMSHSDNYFIPQEDREKIPQTKTSAVTVSEFGINKILNYCETEDEKAGIALEYLDKYLKEYLKKNDYFRAVIFVTAKEEVEGLKKVVQEIEKGQNRSFKTYSIISELDDESLTRSTVSEFVNETDKDGAFLICIASYLLDDLSICDFAVHFGASNEKLDKKRNGYLFKVTREAVRGENLKGGRPDVDIIYIDTQDSENLKDCMKEYEEKTEDLEKIRTEVEAYLTGNNEADKNKLGMLKGE